MDIVNETEICALSLEKEIQIKNAELLRQSNSNFYLLKCWQLLATYSNINFKN